MCCVLLSLYDKQVYAQGVWFVLGRNPLGKGLFREHECFYDAVSWAAKASFHVFESPLILPVYIGFGDGDEIYVHAPWLFAFYASRYLQLVAVDMPIVV